MTTKSKRRQQRKRALRARRKPPHQRGRSSESFSFALRRVFVGSAVAFVRSVATHLHTLAHGFAAGLWLGAQALYRWLWYTLVLLTLPIVLPLRALLRGCALLAGLLCSIVLTLIDPWRDGVARQRSRMRKMRREVHALSAQVHALQEALRAVQQQTTSASGMVISPASAATPTSKPALAPAPVAPPPPPPPPPRAPPAMPAAFALTPRQPRQVQRRRSPKRPLQPTVAPTLDLHTILQARRGLRSERVPRSRALLSAADHRENNPFVISLSALSAVKLRKTSTRTASANQSAAGSSASSALCSVRLRKSNVERSPGGTPAPKKLVPSRSFSTTNEIHRSLVRKFRSVSRLTQQQQQQHSPLPDEANSPSRSQVSWLSPPSSSSSSSLVSTLSPSSSLSSSSSSSSSSSPLIRNNTTTNPSPVFTPLRKVMRC